MRLRSLLKGRRSGAHDEGGRRDLLDTDRGSDKTVFDPAFPAEAGGQVDDALVLRKGDKNQPADVGLLRQYREEADQKIANPLSLPVIDHGDGDFAFVVTEPDQAPHRDRFSACEDTPSLMISLIDLGEVSELSPSELVGGSKKPQPTRTVRKARHSSGKQCLVLGSDRPEHDLRSVVEL